MAEIDLNFRDRWNESRFQHRFLPTRSRPPLRAEGSLPGTEDGTTRTHIVQVLRTYATIASPLHRPATFAPKGERSYLSGYLKAIGRAERFIYVEDQYLVSLEIARALTTALERVEKLIIVVPAQGPRPRLLREAFDWHRNDFIRLLRQKGERKVHVFELRQPRTSEPIWVHSKLMIIDDVYAAIGSANLNRRGMEHDSELGIAVVNQASCSQSFAQDLRRRLWAEHLGLDETDTLLDDPVASVEEWVRQADSGDKRVRHHGAPSDEGKEHRFLWDFVIDPNG